MNRISNVTPFDETHSAQIPIGGTVILFTFPVPTHCVLRVKKFANYTDIPAALGTGLTWHINRNGIGVFRYHNILEIIGMSYQPEDVNIPVFKGGDVLTVVTVNGTAGIVLSGIRIVFDLEDAG